MQFPCAEIWDAVFRILGCIKNAQVKSVCKKENKGITNIVGYSNANRVGSPIDR
jgi:hypothetical protein